MTQFLVMMPHDWSEAERYLCRPLIGDRQVMKVPWLAVATGVANGNFAFVANQDLDRHTAQQQVATATTQLASQTVEWQIVEKRGLIFKRPSLVRAIVPGQTAATPEVMDDLSCEQLVSPQAMQAAGEVLSATSLLAIVPMRGWLMVGAGSSVDMPQISRMHELATQLMSYQGRDRHLSSDVFCWDNGTLIGQSVREASSGYISLGQPQESAWSV